MDTAVETASFTGIAANQQAANNFRANLAAMAEFQPELAERLRNVEAGAEWIFARDGYLTCRRDGAWWSGCSVPLRTARQLLKKLELTGTLGCFLHPAHAAQIRAAFEKILPIQAILAVIPDLASLHVLLHCDDFSAEIGAARLFFVAGENWPEQLGATFEKYSGVPLPQQFLRTALLDDGEMNDLTSDAQRIISLETAGRSDRMPEILTRGQNRTPTGRVLVLAGSQVNLADLSNLAMRRALLGEQDDSSFVAIDPDYPLTASPLALAEAAADVDAMVAADVFRADLPNVVSGRTAWITWVTSGRIVSYDAKFVGDALLLADAAWEKIAISAGWPTERIRIAGWPLIVPSIPATHSPPVLGLLTDTRAIEIPQKVKDFSSQLLLWEYIEDELSRDPLALGDDPQRYLDSRKQKLNIREEGFDRAMFQERLVAPAYKRGLSLLLLNGGIRLALFGRGWDGIAELKSCLRGPIESLDDLARAVSQCNATLQAFPDRNSAAAAGLPLPGIQTVGLHPGRLLSRIREALGSRVAATDSISPVLDKNLTASLLVRSA